MQTKYSFTAMTVILLVSVAMMSIGISMHAYAQNITQPADTAAASQTTNMTNMTGLPSSTGENDDVGEGEEEGPGEDEEGPGEDEDEPGDVDTNDKED
jgi:hypothetical protein